MALGGWAETLCGGRGRYRWENPLSHVLRVLGDTLGIQLAFSLGLLYPEGKLKWLVGSMLSSMPYDLGGDTKSLCLKGFSFLCEIPTLWEYCPLKGTFYTHLLSWN